MLVSHGMPIRVLNFPTDEEKAVLERDGVIIRGPLPEACDQELEDQDHEDDGDEDDDEEEEWESGEDEGQERRGRPRAGDRPPSTRRRTANEDDEQAGQKPVTPTRSTPQGKSKRRGPGQTSTANNNKRRRKLAKAQGEEEDDEEEEASTTTSSSKQPPKPSAWPSEQLW